MKRRNITIYAALILLMLFSASQLLLADSLRISQIDASTLLLNQKIKAYVSVNDSQGTPIMNVTDKQFTVYESADGINFQQIPAVLDVRSMVTNDEGINFLLLIDNSGSMYRTMKNPSGKRGTRLSHAKDAIVSFLNNVKNPEDRVGLVSYNSYYTLHTRPVEDTSRVRDLLEEIQKPIGDEGHTEIYGSLYLAVKEFSALKGRKVIIVLSDGENRSFYANTGKAHADFGTHIYRYSEPIDSCQKEGISVFAINFGSSKAKRDRRLKDIALETGGLFFDARNGEELDNVYATIVNQVLHEYRITYEATMIPADKRYVKIDYRAGRSKESATRFYFSSNVFGMPLKDWTPLLLLPLLLAFLLAWLLSKITFEQGEHEPNLAVLNSGAAEAVTQFIQLDRGKTIIGGNENADLTIMGGVTKVDDKHAEIVFDEKKKKYTILSEGKLKVNNQPTKNRVLESGDVINVDGTTIVFDDGKVD